MLLKVSFGNVLPWTESSPPCLEMILQFEVPVLLRNMILVLVREWLVARRLLAGGLAFTAT